MQLLHDMGGLDENVAVVGLGGIINGFVGLVSRVTEGVKMDVVVA